MSPEWERTKKLRLLLTGLALMIGYPIIAVVGVTWTFFLPVSENTLSIGVALTVGMFALFGWLLGLSVLLSQSYFRGGFFDVAGSRVLVRQALVLCIGTVVMNGFSEALLALIISTSADRSSGPIVLDAELVLYLVFMAAPMFMAGIAWWLMFKSVRPEPPQW
ncbi:hypothetical protein [Saccharopolyspora gloriosae]|uniref:Uncharacterized protein n=1 Tax=Saccharopolyspora gloriosae TaxID=455344 RepID=A0A840N953_9PSEU|nr:hypothetical protein [Saccharopolyspora gloriosae]MBB5067371.1 hypothetical protein [Saccharopolyspora gloriosae]